MSRSNYTDEKISTAAVNVAARFESGTHLLPFLDLLWLISVILKMPQITNELLSTQRHMCEFNASHSRLEAPAGLTFSFKVVNSF